MLVGLWSKGVLVVFGRVKECWLLDGVKKCWLLDGVKECWLLCGVKEC